MWPRHSLLWSLLSYDPISPHIKIPRISTSFTIKLPQSHTFCDIIHLEHKFDLGNRQARIRRSSPARRLGYRNVPKQQTATAPLPTLQYPISILHPPSSILHHPHWGRVDNRFQGKECIDPSPPAGRAPDQLADDPWPISVQRRGETCSTASCRREASVLDTNLSDEQTPCGMPRPHTCRATG